MVTEIIFVLFLGSVVYLPETVMRGGAEWDWPTGSAFEAYGLTGCQACTWACTWRASVRFLPFANSSIIFVSTSCFSIFHKKQQEEDKMAVAPGLAVFLKTRTVMRLK